MATTDDKYLNGAGVTYMWGKIKATFLPVNQGSTSDYTSKVMVTDSSGDVKTSTITATELGYLSGVTSNIQTQLGNKADSSALTGKMNKNITVAGSSKTTADVKFVNGTNTTVAWDSTNSAVKVNVDSATATTGGALTDAMAVKLNGIEAGANNYTLPDATTSVKGGVIIGSNISVSSGTISVATADGSNKGVAKLYNTSSTATDGAFTASYVSTQLGNKAPLASPALTGTPTAPTANAGTNSTQIATTAFVQSAIGSATTGAAVFKGVANNDDSAASPTIKNLTNYKQGWHWVVGTAGTYATQACEVGDLIYCTADYNSAYSAGDFTVIQTNIDPSIFVHDDDYLTSSEIDTLIAAAS